jgi:hypothetical protein
MQVHEQIQREERAKERAADLAAAEEKRARDNERMLAAIANMIGGRSGGQATSTMPSATPNRPETVSASAPEQEAPTSALPEFQKEAPMRSFTPRQVPDTAPRAKFHFDDRQPSASRARPQPQAPLSSDFQHPPKPSLAEKGDKAPLREWQALVDGDPLEVASLYEDSPFYETILQVLKSNHSVAGNLWHHRSLYVESTVEQWVKSQMQDGKNSVHHQLLRVNDLTSMKFPKALTSTTADIAAKSWDEFRLIFIRKLEGALLIGCTSMEIFRALIASTSNVGDGNPKMKAFLLDLVEDYVLGRNSPLACDVLMRKADHSFAIGAAGYSQESASIAWDRMFERTPGIDTVEVAKTLTRAYIQKQGDKAAINVRTVWDHAHMAHEINDRMITILSNDLASAERGKDNARKFKELLATARVRVQNGDARPQEASCVQLCQNYLGPYEESRADLYKTSNESGPERKPPSRSVNNIRAQITAETTTSSRSASNEFNYVAAIAALQSQINNMQQNQMGAQQPSPRLNPIPPPVPTANDYRRAPAPSSYAQPSPPASANSPYPTIQTDSSRGTYANQRGRSCAPPTGGQGLPANSGATEWNMDLWSRARARFYAFSKYAAHPVVNRALAYCRPCDSTMTKPRVDELGTNIVNWTNENGCAYCAFRPRAPPGTPDGELWKYGTGDGAHNPVTCRPYIRYLCEAGAGEIPADEEVKKLIQSLVGLKPIA